MTLDEASLYDTDSMLVQQLADSRARLLLLRNRASVAYAQLRAQLEWQGAWGYRNPGWTSTRSLAVGACLALGKRDEARCLATQDLEAARSFGAPRSAACNGSRRR